MKKKKCFQKKIKNVKLEFFITFEIKINERIGAIAE